MRRSSPLCLAALALAIGSGCYAGVEANQSLDDAGSSTGGSESGPGDDSSGGGDDLDPEVPEGERTQTQRWRRLTAEQYANAVHDLLGVEVDTSSFLAGTVRGASPFPSNAGTAPQSIDIEVYWQTANAVADDATSDLVALLDCGGVDEGTGCAEVFIEDFATRAFRRPLTDAQRDVLMDLYGEGANESVANGLRMVIAAVLQSPQFLYVVEVGEEIDDGLYALDGYEIAARMALLVTNTLPDRELLEAAPSLADPNVRAAQAERLMDTPAFIDAMVAAQLQLTQITRLDSVTRAEPEFTPELRASMRDEAIRFIREILVRDGTLAGLLETPAAFPDQNLARDVYGFGGDGSRVDVTDGTRAGLLTLPAFLASSPPIESDFEVVYRGNAIRTRLLCDELPPPGDAAMFMPTEEDLTPREKLERHQEDPSCAGCHVLMDNIGFGLLNYDDLGRWRDTDSAGPIDASGYILSEGEQRFEDPVDLSRVLASLPQFRDCMSRQVFRLALDREPDDADAVSIEAVESIMSEGGGDLRAAIMALVTSDTFVLRRGS